MFQIDEDKTIYVTRGDVAFFSVSAESNGELYKFQKGDVVRMKVFEKKHCENVAFQKDFPVLEECESVNILLTEEETKIGEVISKAKDYWYEIELNPYTNPQTIIGYDDDGAKIFKLFPEGRDLGNTTDPEYIPVVDKELSLTSDRPLENQAIARAFLELEKKVSTSNKKVEVVTEDVTAIVERVEEILRLSNFDEGARVYELTHEEDDNLYKSTATLTTNGIVAAVHLQGVQSKNDASQSGSILFELPEELRPLGKVTVLTIEDENVLFRICADEDNCALTYYGNTGNSRYMNQYFFYPLKNAGLAEITDARVGADGTIYNSLGEAIRKQAKKLSVARIGEVELLADYWETEGDNLYSQLITIDGVTENTQVDLTPSVQQLAVFYEKDIAFVTENEDGLVTVYVIGQKPVNDYTIQVTMTEVAYG